MFYQKIVFPTLVYYFWFILLRVLRQSIFSGHTKLKCLVIFIVDAILQDLIWWAMQLTSCIAHHIVQVWPTGQTCTFFLIFFKLEILPPSIKVVKARQERQKVEALYSVSCFLNLTLLCASKSSFHHIIFKLVSFV